MDRAAIEATADQVLGSRDVVRLVTRSEDGPRWSNTELLRVEQAALRLAGELRAVPDRNVDPDLVETALAGWTLSAEQQAMVRALATADGLAVVIGPAGSGKTAALTAAVNIWSAQGPPPRARHRHPVHLPGAAAHTRPSGRPGDRPPVRADARWRRGGR